MDKMRMESVDMTAQEIAAELQRLILQSELEVQ